MILTPITIFSVSCMINLFGLVTIVLTFIDEGSTLRNVFRTNKYIVLENYYGLQNPATTARLNLECLTYDAVKYLYCI